MRKLQGPLDKAVVGLQEFYNLTGIMHRENGCGPDCTLQQKIEEISRVLGEEFSIRFSLDEGEGMNFVLGVTHFLYGILATMAGK